MKNFYYALVFALFVFANMLIMRHLSASFLVTATINTFITAFSLFAYQSQPFSLYKLLNLFVLIFFVLANAIQFSTGSIVTSLFIDFTVQEYESFQFLTLLILIMYNGIYYYTFRYKNKKNKRCILKTLPSINFISLQRKKSRNNVLLLLSIFALIIILIHYNGNINRLIFRGMEEDIASVGSRARGSKMMGLLFGKIIRPIPFCCYFLSLLFHTNKKLRISLFFIMLVALFPTSLSRNAAAMYWLPVLLTRFEYLRRKNVFIFLMTFGLLVVFPFLGNFRYYNGEIDNSGYSLRYLYTMNFDASQEFMAAMKMNLITNGRQLLGVLLFFIPRSIWPTKPIGSGAYMASQQFDTFSNISMPFFGEGFINFGYWGIAVFTFFIAWFTAFFDSNYWYKYLHNINNSILEIGIYLILIGAFMFILRGDLLSSSAYTVGTCFSFIVTYMLVNKDSFIHSNSVQFKK